WHEVSTVRGGPKNWSGTALGEPFRTDDRGRPTKASPETSHDLASGRGLSENRRPYGLSLRLNAEGEVLDVLVQSKRNKHAALKLMRKLLKKYAFAPERLAFTHEALPSSARRPRC